MRGTSTLQRVPAPCGQDLPGLVWVHGGENVFHQGICLWGRGEAQEGHEEV